jgi:hypothetical protein
LAAVVLVAPAVAAALLRAAISAFGMLDPPAVLDEPEALGVLEAPDGLKVNALPPLIPFEALLAAAVPLLP